MDGASFHVDHEAAQAYRDIDQVIARTLSRGPGVAATEASTPESQGH